MIKQIYVVLVFILCSNFKISAQKDSITQRIILIGDGGSLTNGRHPVRDAVRKLIKLDKKTTVLFLGDNIYPSGLQDEELYNYDDGKAALDSQLAIADGTDAKIIMIPGNHDWDEGKRTGLKVYYVNRLMLIFFPAKAM
jgi:hypothetical protein